MERLSPRAEGVVMAWTQSRYVAGSMITSSVQTKNGYFGFQKYTGIFLVYNVSYDTNNLVASFSETPCLNFRDGSVGVRARAATMATGAPRAGTRIAATKDLGAWPTEETAKLSTRAVFRSATNNSRQHPDVADLLQAILLGFVLRSHVIYLVARSS